MLGELCREGSLKSANVGIQVVPIAGFRLCSDMRWEMMGGTDAFETEFLYSTMMLT